MQLFAEVILPLPLSSTYTYAIPEPMADRLKIGSRVVVQFGMKKFYTAIVVGITHIKPEGFETKDISILLDDEPIVKHPQMRLWNWIADYYLCSVGDVMKAALPAGLKVESETFVEVNDDYEVDADGKNALNETEASICRLLSDEGRLTPAQISKKIGVVNAEVRVARLLEKRAVIVSEKIVERYRSKREVYVRLNAEKGDNDRLHSFFDMVARAKKQENVLVAMLEMSDFMRHGTDVKEVRRADLIERTGMTSAVVNALAAKGILDVYSKEVGRFALVNTKTIPIPELSLLQNGALKSIHQGFIDHSVVLLRGVTSSGKTEIYIHLIDYILGQKKQALYLVPEIALTTQLTRRLQAVFGDKVVIYHSKFSDNERVDIYKRLLRSGEPCVVVGARSAIFLPFTTLGIVIVDEEHESSYKQFDPAPRYNARDCAIVLASMHGAKTLLGSATPSIETYYKAKEGKYGLVELLTRYNDVELPEIEIVDLKLERKKMQLDGMFSGTMATRVGEALSGGGQAILFHNRRGFAPVAQCSKCGWVKKCDNCDVSLTFHRSTNLLECHYCGATYKVPEVCPACGEPGLEQKGYGTERIEEQTAALFPEAKILRMDLDSTRNKSSYSDIIDTFSSGKAKILVGTQMVTKGLDFEGVSLVGVMNADAVINYPDFRSAERAFNMLEQVSGRSGRRKERGRVVIQSFEPENPILGFVLNHDYEGFYNHEIEERRTFAYPPFTRVIYIYLKHTNPEKAYLFARHYADRLSSMFGNRVSGPVQPTVGKVQSMYIQMVMLKVETGVDIRVVKEHLRILYAEIRQRQEMRSLVVYYDVDPY
ncbi:MAG: primosomal protein N' [Muribaculaceae bacterium]|nr:primosomal protein N' [Muribaculaceae bacterium]